MKKINYKKLEEQLTLRRETAWEKFSDRDKKEVMQLGENYRAFLDQAKTEREAVITGVVLAKKAGFKPLDAYKTLKAGDKVYILNRDKSVLFATIGTNGLQEGCAMVMAHVDSPHLDLKVNPLYEDTGLALFKTHYYGGIKKYQWPTIPLALHGVVVLRDGTNIDIRIGEREDDPIFIITDLLPHLSKDQLRKNLEEAISAEELNIIVGSLPVGDADIKEKIKLAVLQHLYEHYGMTEQDFVSAELHAVPASRARDVGFDRSLIAAFGHDDRASAYTSLCALLEAKAGARTQVCLWIDREEIGSEGNTGAQSLWLENTFVQLLEKMNQPANYKDVYRVLARSYAISADVTVAFDPDYKTVHDAQNVAYIGYGVAVERYTGRGGKYLTSEASSQYMHALRIIFDRRKVVWQTGGLGKVDQGGGGTIAMYLAKRNMDVVDIGIGVLNMHAPLEVVSKADVYCAYRAYRAFMEEIA